MGLRLYEAPVESDIKPKPAVDKIAAEARSTIRRSRTLRGNIDNLRERSRRFRAVVAQSSQERATSLHAERQSGSQSIAEDNGGELPRDLLHSTTSRLESLGDRISSMLSAEDFILPRSMPAFLVDNRADTPERPDAPSRPRSRAVNPYEQYPISNVRSSAVARRHAARHPFSRTNVAERRAALADRQQANDSFQRYESRRTERAARRLDEIHSLDQGQFRGLGDRNRSPSLDDDNGWHTLLSTIPPDPQPPSVGSSFASASASAAASQSAALGSSSTSLTEPDAAEDSSLEHPCESGLEGSDTDADFDFDLRPSAPRADNGHLDDMLALFVPSQSSPRRSYAEVTRRPSRSSSHDELAGMLRIVSNLARREDIPDEWWAEAGLSRTLSRESS